MSWSALPPSDQFQGVFSQNLQECANANGHFRTQHRSCLELPNEVGPVFLLRAPCTRVSLWRRVPDTPTRNVRIFREQVSVHIMSAHVANDPGGRHGSAVWRRLVGMENRIRAMHMRTSANQTMPEDESQHTAGIHMSVDIGPAAIPHPLQWYYHRRSTCPPMRRGFSLR